MRLKEYQVMGLFRQFEIPVLDFVLCKSSKEVACAFESFNSKIVLKAQVLTGGRGKAGGIKFASTAKEAEEEAGRLLNMNINGYKVNTILVCKAENIQKEFYISFVNDRNLKSVLLMASSEGGMDIEETAKTSPDKIFKLPIDATLGLQRFQVRTIACNLTKDEILIENISAVILNLYHCFISNDATLAEINPLIISKENEIIALDGKMEIDDNALFRQSALELIFEPDHNETLEMEAKSKGLTYIKLEGNIGCMVNGAGLAMATMDMIKLYGGKPANFLDIGGSSNPQKVIDAMDLITRDKNVSVVMINIFGGITRCDDVAKGLIEAIKNSYIRIPIVIRLAGTNAKEGLEILKHTDLISVQSMEEAAKIAVELTRD